MGKLDWSGTSTQWDLRCIGHFTELEIVGLNNIVHLF